MGIRIFSYCLILVSYIFFTNDCGALPSFEFGENSAFSLSEAKYLNRDAVYFLLIAGLVFIFVFLANFTKQASQAFFRNIIYLICLLVPIACIAGGAVIFNDFWSSKFLATHESEWLAYSALKCDLFIQGWAINCFPSIIGDMASQSDYQILFGRMYRFALGLLPFSLTPFILFLGYKAEFHHKNKEARDLVTFRVAVALVPALFFQGFFLSYGDVNEPLSHIPVRDISLAILLIMFFLVLIVQRSAFSLILRLLLSSVISAFAIHIAAIVNIVSIAQFVSFILLLVLILRCSVRPNSTIFSASYLFLTIILSGLLLLILNFITPELVRSTMSSFNFFIQDGRYIFPDQMYNLSSPRTLISLLMFSFVSALLILSAATEGLELSIKKYAVMCGYALCVLINLFLVTGRVTSTFGSVLLMSHLLGNLVSPAIDFNRDLRARDYLPLYGILCLSILSILISYTAFQNKRAIYNFPKDSEFLGESTINYFKSQPGCFFSLLSESSLGAILGKRLCSHATLPWYYSRLDYQKNIVSELSMEEEILFHVASKEGDHNYLPNRHLSEIFNWVVNHGCPSALIGSRWYWNFRSQEKCDNPIEHNYNQNFEEVILKSLDTQAVKVRIEAPNSLNIGVLLFSSRSGDITSLDVGSVEDAQLVFSIAPTKKMLSEPQVLLLTIEGKTFFSASTVQFSFNKD